MEIVIFGKRHFTIRAPPGVENRIRFVKRAVVFKVPPINNWPDEQLSFEEIFVKDLPEGKNSPSNKEDSFLRVLFSWPHVLVVILLGIIALIALLYAFEDWRGERAWNKYRKQLEAQGEQLVLEAFIPAAIADEHNFAENSTIRSWFPKGGTDFQSDNYARASALLTNQDNTRKPDRQLTDLARWKVALERAVNEKDKRSEPVPDGEVDFASRGAAAREVLTLTADFQPIIDDLQEASQRTNSRYPVTYLMHQPWGTLLPHLENLSAVCKRLNLKACAELVSGNGDAALRDVKLSLFLADSLKNEPFLLSYLVRLSNLRRGLHPVWEGLAEQRWTDSQLQHLQKVFLKYDIVADLKQPMRSERATALLTIELFRKNRKLSEEIFGDPALNAVSELAPKGWFYQEQRNYCRLFQLHFAEIMATTNRAISPASIKARRLKFEEEMGVVRFVTSHALMARLLLPSLDGTALRAARAQVLIDQALIACALERYRLKNSRFPEKLDELTPDFAASLPMDLLSGAPYVYQRRGDTFVLYSPGWNEKDDGGISGESFFDERKGDWVWRYPDR